MSDEVAPTGQEDLSRPWRRFFARVLDYWLLILPVSFATGLLLGSISVTWVLWLQKPHAALLLNWVLAPVVMALEGLLFGWLGTTPGKWLLGVQVRTVDAQRPTLRQYLRRQLDVYVFGIGGWLPVVNLLTNAHQHSRVKRGQPTGYDEGKFVVTARPLSTVRAISAVTAFVALLMVNGHLNQQNRDADERYATGGLWTNKVTGKAVSIPGGWTHRQKQNHDQQDVDMFFNPDAGVYAVFAKEVIPGTFELDDYAAAWVRAVSETMSLYVSSEADTVQGEPAIIVLGSVAKDKSQKVHATLLKKHDTVWRVVLIGTAGSPPDSAAAFQLRQILFSSVD